jgi:hypothetical protein
MRDSPTPTMGSVGSAVFRQPNTLPTSSTTNPLPSKTEGGLSRTPSTRTLTQSRTGPPASPAPPSTTRAFNTAFGNHRKPVSPQREISEPDSDPLQDSESDSSSDGESQSMARSQAFRRPPSHHNKAKYGYTDDDDDDEDGESSGGFLPFATTGSGSADPAATLKSPVKRAYEQRPIAPDSSASSASSAAPTTQYINTNTGKQREASRGDFARVSPASALSPRHRSELSKLSPRVRKDGSEGTPSMGSSFSDLDGMFEIPGGGDASVDANTRYTDASISQSAIEEAFMSHIQHGSGSTTSRMSSISQALRSKYL